MLLFATCGRLGPVDRRSQTISGSRWQSPLAVPRYLLTTLHFTQQYIMVSEAPIQYFKSKDFALDCGKTLPELSVAYQTYGKVEGSDGQKRPTVLVSTCFGEVVGGFAKELCDRRLTCQRAQLKGGGNPLIGEGQPLDPAKYFVVRVGLLGGSDVSLKGNAHDSAEYSL